MGDDAGDAEAPQEEQVVRIQLPLTLTVASHHTLLLLLQSAEANVAIDACKALLAFAQDEEDGPTQIRTTPDQPVEPLLVLVRLLSHEEAELEGVAVTVLATCASEDECRLRAVELECLKPMITQLGHEEPDLQAKSAYSIAMHATDDPVRLAVIQQGGVEALVKLLASDERDVLRNSCLALTCCAKHPQSWPQMYQLKMMKYLIELLGNGNEDVQEQAAYTIGFSIGSEDVMRDFRRLHGVDCLLECLQSPSKVVQQSSSFALSQAAFDFEVRREVRSKDGIRPLAKLLASDDAKVQEQAMMAIANLALDVPTKQAIAVLGGMRFVAGLLSAGDAPVQANACIAVGRLVYDFNSAAEFNEQDGAALLTDILSGYVASCEKWDAAVAAAKEKTEEGGEEVQPEGEEPDMHLGTCVLETLASTTEHGLIREELRQREGLFDKLHIVAKKDNGEEADKALTSLANFTFDVDSRPMLLGIGVVTTAVTMASSDRVGAQLASARALGNFALDEEGRNVMRDNNAMAALVRLLGSKNIETRRTAVMALNMCSRDKSSAVEICNMGGLVELISLKDTHWKQLGEICNDTVLRLFKQNPSAKFWFTGELDFEDKTEDGFYDLGIGRDFSYVEHLSSLAIEADIEVLVADCKKADPKLQALVDSTRSQVAAVEDKEERLKILAKAVSDKLGGPISYDDYGDFGFATDVQRVKVLRKSNVVSMGDLVKGACRHRGFLFKFLADQLGIECKLHRSRHVRGAHVGHAWNTVYTDYDKQFVVDLMHSVGELYQEGSEEARKYARLDAFAFATLK